MGAGVEMSFIITLYVREGIVIASDSRLTLSTTRQEGDKQVVQLAVGQSDSNYKIFLAPKNIGIATFGAADIQGVPIAGYIESFINEHLTRGNYEVDQVPQEILSYFRNFSPPPDTGLGVCKISFFRLLLRLIWWMTDRTRPGRSNRSDSASN